MKMDKIKKTLLMAALAGGFALSASIVAEAGAALDKIKAQRRSDNRHQLRLPPQLFHE